MPSSRVMSRVAFSVGDFRSTPLNGHPLLRTFAQCSAISVGFRMQRRKLRSKATVSTAPEGIYAREGAAAPIGRPSRISAGKPPAYAANARRTATDSICSAAGVNCEPMTSPMRRNVMSATGSQSAVETPSANIAIVRCSSESRSVQEMPSTVHLGSSLPPSQDGTSSVKVLLNSTGGPCARGIEAALISIDSHAR